MAATTTTTTLDGESITEAIEHSARDLMEPVDRYWIVPAVPGAARPLEIQTAMEGMRLTTDPASVDFIDRLGRGVSVPRIPDEMGTLTSKSWVNFGVAAVLWDFLLGRIALGEDRPDREPILYVRDWDRAGRPLPGWHRIASTQIEYGIDRKDMLAGLDSIIIRMLETSDRPRVRRGIRFRNVAFTRVGGRVVKATYGSEIWDEPFEVTLDCDYDDQLADAASEQIRLMTADDGSFENLMRWFVTPLLEPFKHLGYIIYGSGGNGKGTLLRGFESCKALRGLCQAVDIRMILSRGGGFTQESAIMSIMGKLWIWDEDSPELTIAEMEKLKKVCTGDSLTGRLIGGNSVTFHVEATPAIMTNESITTPPSQAGERRFAYVLTKDDRPKEELDALNRFITDRGIEPFFMASCRLWLTRGDDQRAVALGNASQLTDHEMFIVDAICRSGFCLSADPAMPPANAAQHKNAVAKLGLRSTKKRVTDANGERRLARVLVVENEQRFAPYRAAAAQADAEADAEDARAQQAADAIYAALDCAEIASIGLTMQELIEQTRMDAATVIAGLNAMPGQVRLDGNHWLLA